MPDPRHAPSLAGRAFASLTYVTRLTTPSATLDAGGGMYSSDWLTIVWLVVTAFLAALLGYVLLHTM